MAYVGYADWYWKEGHATGLTTSDGQQGRHFHVIYRHRLIRIHRRHFKSECFGTNFYIYREAHIFLRSYPGERPPRAELLPKLTFDDRVEARALSPNTFGNRWVLGRYRRYSHTVAVKLQRLEHLYIGRRPSKMATFKSVKQMVKSLGYRLEKSYVVY